MDATDRKSPNAKFSVLFKLSMRNQLFTYNAEKLAIDWLAKHPEHSWETLLELLGTGQVIYKQGILDDVPQPTKAEIELLIDQMRGQEGIEITNRWYHCRLYRTCFIGSQAVEWLMNNRNISKEEALRLGQILIDAKVFHHVHDEHNFEDDYLFYRFYLDE